MKAIYEKNGFSFTRIEEEEYILRFSLCNPKIHISNLLDFTLIPLIYELNKDIIEFIDIERTKETEAIAVILIKNLFEDLGLPQRYLHVRIQKQVEDQRTLFLLGSLRTHRPAKIPLDAQLLEVDEWLCESVYNSLHTSAVFTLHLHNVFIPSFAEKLVGALSFKVFDRVKQFTENINREKTNS